MVKVTTREIFKHHLYMFAGNPIRQSKGGPIGLRLTSLVARIIMDQWMVGFLVAVTNAGLEVHAVIKYVDDVNLVLTMLQLGTRWVNGQFITKDKWIAEDVKAGRSREHVTLEAVQAAADSVFVFLNFSSDIQEKHDNNMVPMFDIQIWIEHKEDGGTDVLCWTFYRKPLASVNVLKASSAYSWRSKLITLSMEIFRCMHNMSRQVHEESRLECLAEFILKLRRSGYVQATVSGIIESGLTF